MKPFLINLKDGYVILPFGRQLSIPVERYVRSENLPKVIIIGGVLRIDL